MKFTHLIEINAPGNPLIAPLTRQQLWHGLVLRAERPTLFVIGLDACDILERSVASIKRELRFGELVIHDLVRFDFLRNVHYQVPQQNEIPASDLNMTIEEPNPGALFVRFDYDDHADDNVSTEDAFYNEFRRSAYQEADIDTIRIIRELPQEGQLDTPMQ